MSALAVKFACMAVIGALAYAFTIYPLHDSWDVNNNAPAGLHFLAVAYVLLVVLAILVGLGGIIVCAVLAIFLQ